MKQYTFLLILLFTIPILITAEGIVISQIPDPAAPLPPPEPPMPPPSAFDASSPDAFLILAGSVSGILLISVLILIIIIFILLAKMKDNHPVYYEKTNPHEIIRLADIQPTEHHQDTSEHNPAFEEPQKTNTVFHETNISQNSTPSSDSSPVEKYIIARLKTGQTCKDISINLINAGYSNDQIKQAYLNITTRKYRQKF